MDFAPSNFFFIFPRGFIPCLFEREPRTLPSMVLHFHLPRRFSPCLFEKEPQSLPSMAVHFAFPQRIYTVRELSWILPSVKFHFHPHWFFILLLNPQQFCPLKDPFYFIILMRECVDSWASTNKWFRLLAFGLRCLRATKSREGTIDTPICTGWYSWSLISVMII